MRSIKQALNAFKRKAKPFFRSLTVYVGLGIAALPDLLPLISLHSEDLAAFIPRAWLDPSIRLLGVLVLVARARTLLKHEEPK